MSRSSSYELEREVPLGYFPAPLHLKDSISKGMFSKDKMKTNPTAQRYVFIDSFHELEMLESQGAGHMVYP